MTQPYPPYPPQYGPVPGAPQPQYGPPPAAPPMPAQPQPGGLNQWYPAQHSAPPAPQPQPSAPPAPLHLPAGGIGAPAATNDPNLVRPSVADMDGRLLLIRPTKIELQRPSQKFKDPQGNPTKADTITADVIVLDGPPFPYGGSPHEGKPHTHFADRIPFEIPSMWINQTVLVDQLRGCLEPGRPPMVCGRRAE